MTTAAAAGAGQAGDARRRATGLAVAAVCLLLAVKLASAGAVRVSQIPWVVALFVLPLLYAVPVSRRLVDRYRWHALAVQGVLTWLPFAVFGGRWVAGMGGLLAGLVVLTVRGRVPWLIAGLLLAADVMVRAAVTGLPLAPVSPAWLGGMWAVVAFVDDGLYFFGMVRLAQIVGEVEQARRQAVGLAAAGERLAAARSLQAAVGRHLAGIAARAAAARRALASDAARARAQIAGAGTAAREAVAQARAVAAGRFSPPAPEPAAAPGGGAVIGARLAWAVLVTVLCVWTTWAVSTVIAFYDSLRFGTLLAAANVLIAVLQLRHSGAARQDRRPSAWPVTLGLQAVLAYVFFLPSLADFMNNAAFLAGSVLLLVPGRWRWAGYAALIVSWPALYAVVPLHAVPAADRGAFWTLYQGAGIAVVGLLVYGLSRLAGLARELEGLRGELARAAAVAERLRVARDVHDLLGLGLSAVALKADLAGALIGRDNTRAASEIGEMSRICAAARADIRRVTGAGMWLSLAGELAAARRILTSAGIEVRADVGAGPLPGVADEVLAPVLREAVTNILRHAAATACVIEVTSGGGVVRLAVSNDGIARAAAALRPAGDRGGHGLANLDARVRAAGGQLVTRNTDGRFDLVAEIYCPAPALGGPR
jgi:two-component system sensor histidine kinase DesK